ncbi:MAG: glycosyltransferase family 92 protein [Selenomonadaceae bacterium]|nr:glycosyltransferase family 92 protein [Selenomonadaceae bacterium]
MNVDKNLFVYGLVGVTIIRDEAAYLKEWLDYHFLAGVDHFIIFDNDSADNSAEVLTPYAMKGLVTLIPYPQTNRQLEAYNDAIRQFKFFCRRMIFFDVDEFIFPQNDKTIAEVVDEILDGTDAAGLAINLHTFGSNDLDKADFSVGVLERFTRRAVDDWSPTENNLPSGNAAVKTIADPRKVKFFLDNPHTPKYFQPFHSVNEKGAEVSASFSVPVFAKKIVVNYYAVQSREEYMTKTHKRETARFAKRNEPSGFDATNRNEIFDDKILAYREKLLAEQIPKGADVLKIFAERKKVSGGRLLKALVANLTPHFEKNNLKIYLNNPKNRTKYFSELVEFYKKAPATFFEGKSETFLTCLTVSSYLKQNYLDEVTGRFFEEASINALCKTFLAHVSTAELHLLIGELPRLLTIPYPAVNALIQILLGRLPQFLQDFRKAGDMENFEQTMYLLKMLQVVAFYRK